MIYLDNAATSWPKPKSVQEAMLRFMTEVGANPGRSGHRLSVEAGRIVNDARDSVAELFNLEDPLRVIFGLNATDGLNLGLRGLLGKGDHVITTGMEHNSVMRPLRDLETKGVDLTVLPCTNGGLLDPGDVEEAIRQNTKLIVVNHASNIVGTIQPIREIGRISREHDLYFMIDAAQTGGCCPIDMERDLIDLIGFTGHKGLLGPQGTGGLVIGERVGLDELSPMKSGGTGSRSEFEIQPDFLPDKYESGTMNTVGLAGLTAGLDFILNETVEAIHEREEQLTKRMLAGLREIPGIDVFGRRDPSGQTPTLSINVRGMTSSDVGFSLDEGFGIMCRVGLHCAPTAHRTIGTFPQGTVRLSMGYFTSDRDVNATVEALTTLSGREHG